MASLLAVEVKFAQSLAANEKTIRFRAIKKLKKYLRGKSSSKKDGFTKEDLLKIWKGLHYCMWMQDKPLIQEELSGMLTQLVHEMSTLGAKMLFVEVFFMTEAREWSSIDVWRLDKYMMLVRNMLNESLVVVKKLNWAPEALDALMQVFSNVMMNPKTDNVPDGLRIHFADIYLDEVEKVGAQQLDGMQLVKMLLPFVKFIQSAQNTVIVKRVITSVLQPVLTRTSKLIQLEANTATEEAEETTTILYKDLQFDIKLLADQLFNMSQEACVLARNRPHLYNIVKRLRDLEQGVVQKPRAIVIESGVTSKDMKRAIKSLVSIDEEVIRANDKTKEKRKKKNKDKVGNENADPNNNGDLEDEDVSVEHEEPSTSTAGGKKKKRKHAALSDDSTDEPLTKLKKKQEKSHSSEGGEKTGLKLLKKALKRKKSKTEKGGMVIGKDSLELKHIHDAEVDTAQQAGDQTGKHKASKKSLSDKSAKHNKNSSQSAETPQDILITADIPASFSVSVTPVNQTKNTSSSTKAEHAKRVKLTNTPASGKKRRASEIFEEAKLLAGKRTEKKITVVNNDKPPPVSDIDNMIADMTDGLQEGETEIFVPSKKYMKKNNLSKSDFAKFENAKTPMAFVRRSFTKLNKSTGHKHKPPSGSAKSMDSLKKVKFNLKKNKSQGFKESLSSPMTPYNPSKKPDQGILKSSATSTTSSVSLPPQSANRPRGTINTPATAPSKRQNTPKQLYINTPVGAKKGFIQRKRAKSSDFFL